MSGVDAVRIGCDEEPTGLDARRRRAIEEAESECVGPTPSSPGIAVRRFGRGCLVIALAGSFDAAALARLDAVRRDLARLADAELVLCTAHLDGCDLRLARLLARLRMQHLVAGARVELHDPPRALTDELDRVPAERFVVRDEAHHSD